MPLPTLLTEGNVVPQKWMSTIEKRHAITMKSIDFVMEFVDKRMPKKRGKYPKIKAKKIGDRVLILKSGTGSGKSTTLPPYLYNQFNDRLHKNIAITQPRRLTAIDIPYQIVQFNPNLQIEKNIGYQTGTISKKPVDGIIFMTIGVLTQQLKTMTPEEFAQKYMFVLIDEVHERDLSNEFALYELKKFLELMYDSPNCPLVILMSATFDKTPYMEYFNVPKENYIEVSGRSFHKEFIFPKSNISDWRTYTVDLVKKIHIENVSDITDNSTFRDILIFVNGAKMMKTLAMDFHKMNIDGTFNKDTGYIGIVMLTSESFSQGDRDYQNLFSPVEEVRERLAKHDTFKNIKGGYDWTDIEKIGGAGLRYEDIEWSDKNVSVSRRVILATNIAETGVTIDTLKYCIETGFVISAEFNPTFAVNLILNKNVTQGMSEQRAGRVGRKAPGVVYFLYTQKTLHSFLKDQYPAIISSDITFEILSAIVSETEAELIEEQKNDTDVGVFMHNKNDDTAYYLRCKKPFSVLSLDFMSFPSAESLQYSLEKLYVLGFITQSGDQRITGGGQHNGAITPTLMGYLAINIRKVRLENIRMIFAGYYYGCNILDLITITAFIELGFRNIFTKSYKNVNVLGKSEDESNIFRKIGVADDFIECLFIWNAYMNTLSKQTPEKISQEAIIKWCENNGYKYNGFLRITEIRNEIIESFINLGYNPFWNGLYLPKFKYNINNMLLKDINIGMSEIMKLKRAICEGYRLNVAQFNSKIKKYVMKYKKITLDVIPSTLVDCSNNTPNQIVVSDILVAPNPMNPSMYLFNAGDAISVIDGFIDDIDNSFITAFP